MHIVHLLFCFYGYGDTRDRHVLTLPFPTRRSSVLALREVPHRISKVPNTVALQPGMIVSNEPGYYKTGAYCIRIENLVAVRELEPLPGAERPMLGFETDRKSTRLNSSH